MCVVKTYWQFEEKKYYRNESRKRAGGRYESIVPLRHTGLRMNSRTRIDWKMYIECQLKLKLTNIVIRKWLLIFYPIIWFWWGIGRTYTRFHQTNEEDFNGGRGIDTYPHEEPEVRWWILYILGNEQVWPSGIMWGATWFIESNFKSIAILKVIYKIISRILYGRLSLMLEPYQIR